MNRVEAKLAVNWQTRQRKPTESLQVQECATDGKPPQSWPARTPATLAIRRCARVSRQILIVRRELAIKSWRNHLRSETIEWGGLHGSARRWRGETV
jgi:hypothetical protein